jgi:hypothetical protein
MLAASRELHKFFHDCKDVLGRILEKQHSMSDELGRDAGSVSALQRKHQTFLQDLLTLQSQVNSLHFVRFEVLTVVTMKNGVFWVVKPCGSCKNQRFGGTWRLLHQGDKNR